MSPLLFLGNIIIKNISDLLVKILKPPLDLNPSENKNWLTSDLVPSRNKNLFPLDLLPSE
jgi:hypothetical protein